MPTVEEVARAALGAVDTDAHLDLAIAWLNERIQEATAYGRFRFLRLTRNITWPAPVIQGSVTVQQGGTKVVGDPVATANWNGNLVGRVFTARNVWYTIEQFEPGVLTLETPYTETTVAVGAYKIVQQVMILPDYRRVDLIAIPRLRRQPLNIITRERLDNLAPSRIYLTSGMRYACAAGEDVEGNLQIEIYPYSSQAETLRVLGYRKPPNLTIDQYVPGAIDPAMLKDGILVDVYRYEQARALKMNNTQQAMLWQQQMVAQEARWRNSRMLLALQDREIDDAMIAPMSPTHLQRYDPEVTTAFDEIYVRGRRP